MSLEPETRFSPSSLYRGLVETPAIATIEANWSTEEKS